MLLEEISLVKTCCAFPEQYDAYHDGKVVAYLRLRHGYFYVSCPDVGGEIVYESEPNGDGMFDDDEREKYLREAKLAIVLHYNTKPVESA